MRGITEYDYVPVHKTPAHVVGIPFETIMRSAAHCHVRVAARRTVEPGLESLDCIAVLLLVIRYGEYAVALPRGKIRAVNVNALVQGVEIGQRDVLSRRDVWAYVTRLNRIVPAALRVGGV